MKIFFTLGLFLFPASFLFAQKNGEIINPKEAERIVKFLSVDALRGRRVFTPDIEKAEDFIVNEFKSIGLQTWNNNDSYQQEFSMILPKFISASAILDGVVIDSDNIIVVTCQQHLKIDQSSGYEIAAIKAGSNLTLEGSEFINSGKNILVMVDESYSTAFSRLNTLKDILIKTEKNVIFILDNSVPKNFKIEARHEIREEKLANIVAVLPGKSRKNEFVIISGHYDHVGT
ncbi:MAG: aminopeptidase, partial [Bacteroidia bacterium]|nr:aminopeptidase [Bacteroidia bacterium]